MKTIGECVVGRRTGPEHPMETYFVCRVRRVLCDAISLRQDRVAKHGMGSVVLGSIVELNYRTEEEQAQSLRQNWVQINR